MNKKIISLLIFLNLFHSTLSMNSNNYSYDTVIVSIPIELWQGISIMLIPELIKSTEELFTIYKKLFFFTLSCKSFCHLFTQKLLKERLLRCCVSSKIIYDGAKKMKKSSMASYFVRSIVAANNDIEKLITITDGKIRTKECFDFIHNCISTWNIEMNISRPSILEEQLCEQEYTFLNKISLLNDPLIMKHLIKKGVNIERKNEGNKTPIHFALSNICFQSAGYLLKKIKKNGGTILHEENYQNSINLVEEKCFCENDSEFEALFNVIKELVEHHYIPIDAEIVSNNSLLSSGKFSLLFAAVVCNNEVLVRYLMKHGAQPYVRYKYNFLERPAGRWVEREDSALSFAQDNRLRNIGELLECYYHRKDIYE